MSRALLALALCCHVAFGTAYLLGTPAFEGPDETGHWAYAQHIAQDGTLPVIRGRAPEIDRSPLDEADMAHHPPLYYLLLAATLRATGRADTLHTPPSDPANGQPGKTMVFLHGADERPPAWHAVWTLRLCRAWSLVCGAVSLLFVYRLGRLTAPDDPILAGLATLTVACLPMWSFLHGVANSDVLATTLSTAALVAIVRWSRTATADLTRRRALGLGLLLGLGISTKLTFAFVFVIAGAVWIGRFVREAEQRRRLAAQLAIAALACAAICGPWIVRNVALFGDPLGLGAHGAVFESTRVTDELRWTWIRHGFLPQIFTSLLGNFGWFRVPPAGWLVVTGSVAACAAVLGLALSAVRGADPRLRSRALLLGTILLVFGLALQFNLEFRQPQGRLLFPGIGALAILAVHGWLTLVRACGPRNAGDPIRALPFALGMPAIAIAVWLTTFRPAFAFDPASMPAHASALVDRIVSERTPTDGAWTWRSPQAASSAKDSPTFALDGIAGADDGPFTLYVYDARGRIWLATWEWARIPLTPSSGFELPPVAWELLPEDRELWARLRRVPDLHAGERLESMPSSAPLPFRRTR